MGYKSVIGGGGGGGVFHLQKKWGGEDGGCQKASQWGVGGWGAGERWSEISELGSACEFF